MKVNSGVGDFARCLAGGVHCGTFARGGCSMLEGGAQRAEWRWHFWQGLWYRWIVDREIGRMKRGVKD